MKFDANGGFGVQAEVVSGETSKELRLSDGGVSDENDLEEKAREAREMKKLRVVAMGFWFLFVLGVSEIRSGDRNLGFWFLCERERERRGR